MTRSIGGDITPAGLAALMGDRPEQAEQHKPQGRRGYQRAVRDLQRQGLTPADIAQSLHLSPTAVRELLAEGPPGEYAPRHRHRGEP